MSIPDERIPWLMDLLIPGHDGMPVVLVNEQIPFEP